MKARAKRALLFATIGCAIVILFSILTGLPPSEPEYDGKKLSYWLSWTHNESLPENERVEIARAITTIGTNNMKLLLKWFREPEPAYELPWYRRLAESALTKLRLIHVNVSIPEPRFRPSHPEMALWVFNEFPSVARTAIPAFTNMVSDRDLTVKGRATLILGNIGKDAIPALIPMLSSPDATNRSLAAFAIGHFGADAIPLIPKLESLLQDESPYPRVNAAEALSKLNGNPHTFVPVLVQCLTDGDDDTKSYASSVLSRLTNGVPLAVAGLLELMATSTNKNERLLICSALSSLDSETAAKVCTNIFDEPITN